MNGHVPYRIVLFRGYHLHFYAFPDFQISIFCLSFLNHSFYNLCCMHFCVTPFKPSKVITPNQFYVKHLSICNLYK